jgi:hypothetical protein
MVRAVGHVMQDITLVVMDILVSSINENIKGPLRRAFFLQKI